MDFNIDFSLVRSQKLLLIPQLKLALDVLEMDSRELFDFIGEQLETNPALEGETDTKPVQEAGDEDADAQLQEDAREDASGMLTLKQHLLIQFNTMHVDKASFLIGEYLIDNTDDNGYLKVDISEVAAFFNVSSERVATVLEQLQSLDPPGICARNLRECLLLQLRQQDEPDGDAIMVVENHIDRIAAGDADSVARETGLPADRVHGIFQQIKSLEPRPGREFYHDAAKGAAPPDILIRETGGGLRAVQNEEAYPDICLSESFRLGAARLEEKEGAEFFHENVKSAVWLIKCLEQRKKLILDIAEKLLTQEAEFFKIGCKYIRKLDKASFAAAVNMHESILDKALNGKTVQCRWGTFALRSFFAD